MKLIPHIFFNGVAITYDPYSLTSFSFLKYKHLCNFLYKERNREIREKKERYGIRTFFSNHHEK